ncbi:MAG TPA: hypothetical protein VFP41_01580 [Actinomycetota bacterium]|nr:hypothetical protein [Actinomycetota bacterium]
MPEDLNAEIAGTLSETSEAVVHLSRSRRDGAIELLEAVFLAIVAIATAWSGYQAARWDGHSAELYAEASTIRIRADQLLTLGGQQRLLDVSTFNTWIEAESQGNEELTALYERRYSPEFKIAFDAWLATDPLEDGDAPPGPSFMPEYVNPELERGAELNAEANEIFDEATRAQTQAHQYVFTTVVLATVLFLLALSQRFRLSHARIAVLVIAGGLMLFGLITIIRFPRL